MKRQLAAFDIDGTILRKNLMLEVVRYLLENGVIGYRQAHDIEKLILDLRHSMADEHYFQLMMKSVKDLITSVDGGLSVEDYVKAVRATTTASLSNTHIYTTQLIKTLKSKNFFLVAISGSEIRAVEEFAKPFGFDAFAGSIFFKESDGRLTGEIEDISNNKEDLINDLIAKNDLDLKGSIAVGDSTNDIPMLSMVETGIAFNPNQGLFKAAQQHGWMVVIERKDMVYGLTFENGKYTLTQTNA